MSTHTAVVAWGRNGATFTDSRYSRAHEWVFDGGVRVLASASPHVVPPPMSRADAVDPEEAFVAAIASCHMLFFLWIAARQGFVVEWYRDDASGVLGRDADGHQAMTAITLSPQVAFAGDRRPSLDEHQAMHHDAHEACFLARSLKTAVRCHPVDATGTT